MSLLNRNKTCKYNGCPFNSNHYCIKGVKEGQLCDYQKEMVIKNGTYYKNRIVINEFGQFEVRGDKIHE